MPEANEIQDRYDDEINVMVDKYDDMLDAVQDHYQRNNRRDSQKAIFVRNLVQATLSEFFREEYTEAKWVNGGLLTISSTVDEGADEYGFHGLGINGRADIISPDAEDIPSSDLKGDYNIRRVQTVGTAFRYSRQDIRKARLQGFWDIATEKANAARTNFDQKIDNLIQNGSKKHGLDGITNLPGARIDTAITGDWLNPSTTGKQILEDLEAVTSDVEDSTNDVEHIDTALFPVKQWSRISTGQFSTASDTTILEYLMKAFPQIKKWEKVSKLKTASSVGGAAVMLYRNDPSRVRGIMPMQLEPLPPEARGYVFKVAMESRWGGVISPKPRSLSRLEGV